MGARRKMRVKEKKEIVDVLTPPDSVGIRQESGETVIVLEKVIYAGCRMHNMDSCDMPDEHEVDHG